MKRKLLLTLGCLVGLATLSYGGYAWYNAITYVSTDDAYVDGTISPVSAKVAGHVVELMVQDNQMVRKGDLLMRVDPRDFQARREQARAAVATAEANLRAARSEVPLTRAGTTRPRRPTRPAARRSKRCSGGWRSPSARSSRRRPSSATASTRWTSRASASPRRAPRWRWPRVKSIKCRSKTRRRVAPKRG